MDRNPTMKTNAISETQLWFEILCLSESSIPLRKIISIFSIISMFYEDIIIPWMLQQKQLATTEIASPFCLQ